MRGLFSCRPCAGRNQGKGKETKPHLANRSPLSLSLSPFLAGRQRQYRLLQNLHVLDSSRAQRLVALRGLVWLGHELIHPFPFPPMHACMHATPLIRVYKPAGGAD